MVVSKKSKTSKTSPGARKSAPLSSKTVAELRALAKEKGVSLSGITRKADIINALAGSSTKKTPVKNSSGPMMMVTLKDYLTLPDTARRSILRTCAKLKGLEFCQETLEYAQFNSKLTPRNQKMIAGDLEYIKKH